MKDKYEPAKMEIFKPIEGYEDYLISGEGRVWSNKSKKFRKTLARVWKRGFIRGNKSISKKK